MKKISFLLRVLLIVVFVSSSVCFLVGCNDEQEIDGFKTVEDIKGLKELNEKGLLKFEWLSDYLNTRPTLIVFHGEQKETDSFSLNLDKSVYTEEVIYGGKTLEENPFGLRGLGFRNTHDGNSYWMENYWTDTAEFNVGVFKCANFFAEETNLIATKIYSTYRMRYVENGELIECDLGVSFTEVVSALYIDEMTKKQAGTEEIRFLGNGIGANLATSVAYYLNSEYEKSNIDGKYLPYRITGCDPYLNSVKTTYSVSFDSSISNENGEFGIYNAMNKKLSNGPYAVEIVESKETDEKGEELIGAYTYSKQSGKENDLYTELKSTCAYLEILESYSKNESFNNYKYAKRIAFDWYIYSIIGSDDAIGSEVSYETYAAGYPHSLSAYQNITVFNSVNWGTKYRRPIMNNRRATNDADEAIASYRGKNYGVGAWTPTPYIKALKGISFYQREAYDYSGNINVHGSRIYNYKPYVLKVFRSENFQVADRTDYTIITGRVYVDENENASMDDGIMSGIKSEMFLKVRYDNSEENIISKRISTDKHGYYTIILKDAKEKGEEMTFSGTEGTFAITGIDLSENKTPILYFTYICPKGLTAARESIIDLFYTETDRHNFNRSGEASIGITSYNVHSVLIKNCLPKRVEQ